MVLGPILVTRPYPGQKFNISLTFLLEHLMHLTSYRGAIESPNLTGQKAIYLFCVTEWVVPVRQITVVNKCSIIMTYNCELITGH